MAAELLPEALWEEIGPLPPPPPRTETGRPPVDNKRALRGIIFVLRFGAPWRAVPTDAFGVSGSSCWRRLSEWTDAGVWPEVHRRLPDRLGKLGGLDLQHVAVGSQSVRAVGGGRGVGGSGGITPARTRPTAANRAANAMCWATPRAPLVVQTTPANVPDQRQLPALLEARPAVQGPRGRPRRNPEAIIGDRAHGAKDMIAHVEDLGIDSLLAERADDTHGSGLGVLRHVIERTLACFLSHFRRLRLCCERRGKRFQAFHGLAAALLVCSRIKSLQLSF